ncbi:MAG: class I SAM-dependent methyltransferase [Halioglobus sp.]|nr:class I SAM-dependent methyltransferase [Halioglobus sp.]
MSEYVYQDKEATMPTLSAMLTSRIGDGSGDHAAGLLNTIELLAAARGEGAMIDIGCGRGRITELAAPLVREVVALEPDPGRCNWTRELLAQRENVTVLQQFTHEYIADHPEKQFDLTVLSMVVQHLSTHNVAGLMADVAALTRPGGIAVVSTTHALDKARCFTYQHVEEARISEEEFNAYADDPQNHDKGLPVHRFSREEFEAIAPADFEMIQWSQFSYYRPEFLERFAQVHRVEPQELADHGNSQLMVLRKRH